MGELRRGIEEEVHSIATPKSPNQMSFLHPYILFWHPRPGQTFKTPLSAEERGM